MRIPVPWVFVLAFLVGVVLQAFIPIAIGAETKRVARIAGMWGSRPASRSRFGP